MERPELLPAAARSIATPSRAPLAVILRVFDRMHDLAVAVELVRRRWTCRPVHVVVVSNGIAAGHAIPAAVREHADQVVELSDNPGREAGAARLIAAGVARVPAGIRHAVLLESDAWVLDDRTVDRWALVLERDGAAWASARWIERWPTVALDFAIADVAVLRAHPELFEGPELEARVANRLLDLGLSFHAIREAMPVHRPRLLASFGLDSRRHAFPGVPMVTHHIETLAGGLTDKMRLANACAGEPIFAVGMSRVARLGMWLDAGFAAIAPRSSWLRSERRRGV